jgi:hypothetical protein
MFMSDMLLRRGATGTECLADERVFRWGGERGGEERGGEERGDRGATRTECLADERVFRWGGERGGEERGDLRGEERDEGCRFQVREEAEGVGSKASSSSSSPSSVSSSEIDGNAIVHGLA